MRPLGIITNYFPFLEEEISRELESLMETSVNYADFLDRVVKHILENESPPMMVFYAVVHLHRISRYTHLELIFERYRDLALLQPFIMRFKIASNEATTTDVLESADQIIENETNSWVLFEMYNIRFHCASTYSLGSVVEEEALAMVQRLINAELVMRCLQPCVTKLKAMRLHLAGKNTDALKLNELRIAQSRSYDEIYQLYDGYLLHAFLIRNLETGKALEMLETAEEIVETLGFEAEELWSYCNVRHSVHNSRGEFDLSLQFLQKAIKNREVQRLQTSLRALPLNMSYVYAELEDGENALEWAKMALANPKFMSSEPGFMVVTLTRLARAFAVLGDIEQAEVYLEKSETESLKVGIDRIIAENLIVTGHIERAKGNLEDAIFHFQKGLDMSEQISYQNRINSCLIGLVKTEIEMLESDESNALLETSGPWMRLLQSEVGRKELPGISGILLLLKVELRLKQGRMEEASSLLEDIKRFAKKPGLGYLGKKADKLQSILELKAVERKEE